MDNTIVNKPKKDKEKEKEKEKNVAKEKEQTIIKESITKEKEPIKKEILPKQKIIPKESEKENTEKQETLNNSSTKKETVVSKPQTTVKITKVKENLTKFTPQYIVSNDDGIQSNPILDENDFKDKDKQTSEISKENYNFSKKGNSLGNRSIDLSGIKSKIETHLGDQKKAVNKFEEDWAKLHEQFSNMNSMMSQGMDDYRKKVLEVKDAKRNIELQNEMEENNQISKLQSKIKEKKLY